MKWKKIKNENFYIKMSNNKKCHRPEPITQSTPCRTLTHNPHKQTHTYKVY